MVTKRLRKRYGAFEPYNYGILNYNLFLIQYITSRLSEPSLTDLAFP